MRWRALSLLPALALAACASTPVRAPTPAYAPDRATCVDTLARLVPDVPPAPARNGAVARVAFRDIAQCLQPRDRGVEPVVLFRIDDTTRPLQLDLGAHRVDNAVPAVTATLLDANLREREHARFDDFAARGNSYTLTMFLPSGIEAPVYLLLRPDDAWLHREIDHHYGDRWTTPIVGGGMAAAYSDGAERVVRVIFGDVGEISLAVTPYRRAKVAEATR